MQPLRRCLHLGKGLTKPTAAELGQEEAFDHQMLLFLLDEWGLYKMCFHCFIGENVNMETQTSIGSTRCQSEWQLQDLLSLLCRTQSLTGISLVIHLLVPQMWLLYKLFQTLYGGKLGSIVTVLQEQSAKLLGRRTQAQGCRLMNTDTLNVHLHKICSKLVCSTLL